MSTVDVCHFPDVIERPRPNATEIPRASQGVFQRLLPTSPVQELFAPKLPLRALDHFTQLEVGLSAKRFDFPFAAAVGG